MKRREFIASLIALGGAALLPLPEIKKPQPKTIFVDGEKGKDSYDGMSINKPKRTIASAIENTTPGSTIWIKGSK